MVAMHYEIKEQTARFEILPLMCYCFVFAILIMCILEKCLDL